MVVIFTVNVFPEHDAVDDRPRADCRLLGCLGHREGCGEHHLFREVFRKPDDCWVVLHPLVNAVEYLLAVSRDFIRRRGFDDPDFVKMFGG
jgi:hypothetical protein